MTYKLRVVAIIVVVLTSFSPVIAAQATAGEEIRLGNQALQKGNYPEAIEHFEKCVALDPQNSMAHLILARAYAQHYIPGADTSDNMAIAEKAIEQYKDALDGNLALPAKMSSTKGIAYLYLQMKKFDDAKQYYHMAADLDGNDAESFYSIAVVDWTVSYQFRQQERDKLRMGPDDSLPARDKSVCGQVNQKNAANVQDGIDNLTTALQLRPDYEDAMAYMNLLYRERADIQCDDPALRAADLKTAGEWFDKAMEIKKAKEEAAKAKEAKSKERKVKAAPGSETAPPNP